MTIQVTVIPTEIDGVKVYTVRQFATIVERTDQTILNLISKGNKIRKLKAIKLGNKPYVLASELTEFPFTLSGKGDEIYYYNDKGAIDTKRSKLSSKNPFQVEENICPVCRKPLHGERRCSQCGFCTSCAE